MTTYYIYKDDDIGYMAHEEDSCGGYIGDLCGSVEIDTSDAWTVGSLDDLNRSLRELAIDKFLSQAA